MGVITDITGALSFMGTANANVAEMVIDDINAAGGLLGRPLELHLEDSATDDGVAAAKAAKLVQEDRVDVILGGIYSSTRQAIKGPAVVEGRTLYIYPEQYEGQEYDPLIFCTGPVPAQQVEPLIPWLMERTGARDVLPAVGRLHLAARHERAGAGGGHGAGRRRSWARSTSRSTTPTTRRPSRGSSPAARRSCSTRSSPRGSRRSSSCCTTPASRARGGSIVCTYFDENFFNLVPAAHVEGLYSCLDYYRNVDDPFSQELTRRYDERYPGRGHLHGRQRLLGPLPRPASSGRPPCGRPARSCRTEVVAALDHARIDAGPGGPAQMVPGQHHARMNMYIAQATEGRFRIVESLGMIDPEGGPPGRLTGRG